MSNLKKDLIDLENNDN